MRFSIFISKPGLRSVSPSKTETPRLAGVSALAAAICIAPIAHADVTFTYELGGADADSVVRKVSINKFFARIDDPAKKDEFLLYQAGKFFPLYKVNDVEKSYLRLTDEVIPFMSPESRKHHGADKAAEKDEPQQKTESQKKPPLSLKATKKNRKVAGIECRIVHELEDKKPVIEHCMANSARLGITRREVTTMARTFRMARERDFGWLGIGSEDEEFISVQSKDLRDNKTLTLTAVSTTPLPVDYLRIPRDYKQVKPGEAEEPAADKTKSETETEKSSGDASGQGAPHAPKNLQ